MKNVDFSKLMYITLIILLTPAFYRYKICRKICQVSQRGKRRMPQSPKGSFYGGPQDLIASRSIEQNERKSTLVILGNNEVIRYRRSCLSFFLN